MGIEHPINSIKIDSKITLFDEKHYKILQILEIILNKIQI